MRRRQFIGTALAATAALPFRGFAQAPKDSPDVAAKSLDGGDLTLRGSSVESLAASLRGDLLLQADAAYDGRRRIWNAEFDRHPALIACCTGAADVRHAVNFAREHRLLTAVRAGGHSLSGKSTCDGGLVIDLQSMRGVRIDAARERAFVEAGSMLGLLDHECAAAGVATTAGIVSHTGAAGLTLGGGFGRLGRRFGLACDNVASFDVVTADGRFLRASDGENSDLFWGLRGGGGNFGVVTAIDYRVHRMDPVIFGGYLGWPIAEARDVMRSYRDAMPSLPEELYVECALVWEKDAPAIAFEVCWSGDRARADEMVKPLRALGKPVYDDLAPIRYADMQTYSDESLAFGKRYYSKSGFLEQLTDDGIDLVIDVFQREPNLFVLFFDPVDGAYHRVAADATAFPHRGAAYWMGLVSVWQDAQASEARIEKIRSAWRELEPLARGFYTNLASPDESLAAYRENYGANLERLIALKAKYDPTNLFRLNANVPPKA